MRIHVLGMMLLASNEVFSLSHLRGSEPQTSEIQQASHPNHTSNDAVRNHQQEEIHHSSEERRKSEERHYDDDTFLALDEEAKTAILKILAQEEELKHRRRVARIRTIAETR